MSTKTTYQTKQKTQVLSYLETIPGQHVTAAQVFKQLSADGCAIGATTVYRCLERLVEALNRESDASPEKLVANADAAVRSFAGAAPQFDDLTMLCVRYYGA